MTLFTPLAVLLSTLLFSATGPQPRGEGSLVGDTPILMADLTEKAVEDLKPGDLVAGWAPGKGVVAVKVTAVDRKNSNRYTAAKAGALTLRASANQWVATASGKLVPLGNLGDESLLQFDGKTLKALKAGVREYPSNLPLFNVALESPGLFFAGGLLVHD